jgi:predicted Zn-dependent peptidase
MNRFSRLRRFPFLAAASVFCLLVFPSAAPGAMEELESRVTEETLANGMKVLLLPRRQSPTVSLSMRFMVGSAQEQDGKSGLAHLLEHMMFKGTSSLGTRDYREERLLREKIELAAQALDEERRRGASRSPENIRRLENELRKSQEDARRYVVKDEIDSIYSANGAQGFNASTGVDLTTYTVSLPANRIRLWARIESERMRDPVMREFYSERDVVVEERLQSFETNPSRKLSALLLSTAFHAHPYRRPVVGWKGDVDFLRRAEAEEFFRTWYAPNNAVLVAVGDFVSEELMEMIRHYFGPLPAQDLPARRVPTEPPQEGERRAVLEADAEPQVMIGFHKPTLPGPDDYVFDLIDGLLAGSRTSRLYRHLVEEGQLAVSVSTTNGFPGARYPNLFVIRAVPRHPHDAAEVESAVLEQLDLLVREGVTKKEVGRVRKRLRADLLRGLQSNAGLAALLSYFQAAAGDWRYAVTHLDVLEGITPEQIRETAARYLTVSNRTVVRLKTRRTGAGEGR